VSITNGNQTLKNEITMIKIILENGGQRLLMQP